MTDEKQTKLVGELKPISSDNVKYELDEFHMKQTTIASVEVVETTKGYVDNKWVENLTVPQKQLLVKSAVLKVVKDKEGKDVEIRACEWFNLIKQSDGGVGWSTHEKGKLHNFLRGMKCALPKDLMGKTAIVKVVEKVGTDGSKTQVMRFMY